MDDFYPLQKIVRIFLKHFCNCSVICVSYKIVASYNSLCLLTDFFGYVLSFQMFDIMNLVVFLNECKSHAVRKTWARKGFPNVPFEEKGLGFVGSRDGSRYSMKERKRRD